MTRCIFCKQASHESKSEEHIIPESLGNSKHTLPAGIICDPCNHYFGAKIEGRLLATPHFKNLRGRQQVENKKGKAPFHTAIIGGIECEVMVSGSRHKDIYFMPKKEEDFGKIEIYLKDSETGSMIIPITLPTDKKILSRFLAKVALEVLTHRIYKIDGWEEQVIDFEPLDAIREYARYGKGPELWPFYERSIYDENHHASDGGQTMHEFDLLYTEQQELYAVICIFGTEYTINLGGPDLEGYEKWLEEHSFKSPLYHGKNSKYLERLG